MKAIHYIATETNLTAETLIWVGNILQIIRKSHLKWMYIVHNGHSTKNGLPKKMFNLFTPMKVG
jgi:predicted ABC-type exoprotein transport system permease subunit